MSASIDRTDKGVNVSNEVNYMGDLYQQVVKHDFTIVGSQLTGAVQGWSSTFNLDLPSESLALDRGEVAELVACKFHGGFIGAKPSDNLIARPASIELEVQGFTTVPGKDTTVDSLGTQQVDDGSGNEGTWDFTEERPQGAAVFLFFDRAMAYPQIEDDANSQGLGGSAGKLEGSEQMFRRDYGRGPLYFWDDGYTIHSQMEVDVVGLDSEVVTGKWAFELVYDIHELDTSTLELRDQL